MASILILTHEFEPFRGGIAAVADGLARGAAAAGHEPIVVAPDYDANRSAEDRSLPFEVRRFPGSTCSMVSLDGLTRYTRHVAGELRRGPADLVHAVDPAAQMALAMLARFRDIDPYFVTVHGTELLRYRDEFVPRLWMGAGIRRARSVHAVSRAVHRILQENPRLAPHHSFVEPPGIRSEWLHHGVADRNDVRMRWNARPEDIVLLTLARRVLEKGHADTIAAAALLPEAMRARIVYVIAGHGPDTYADKLRTAAARAGIRLFMAGRLSDAEAIAACDGADLFVMLSRQTPRRIEGFGIAYIEAGARGLPSLARETGGVGEAVTHGETGIVVPGDADPAHVADALRTLLLDSLLRRELGEAARQRATGFDWTTRARAVYDQFLARL